MVKTRKTINDLNELISMKAGDAFEWCYGFAPKQQIIIKGKEKVFENARDWWERSSPITQCNNTIGGFEGKNCYICGFPIQIQNAQSPECEHILPIYQASLLLHLYNAKSNTKNDKELKLEYDWAHRCCNQIKSDVSFLTYNNNSSRFTINVSATTEILMKIQKGDKYDCDLIKPYISKIKEKPNWVTQRLDAINAEKIQPICNYLNQTHDESLGLFYLGIVSNLITAANAEHIDQSQGKITIEPHIEGDILAVIYTEVLEYINSVFDEKMFDTENKKRRERGDYGTVNEALKTIFSAKAKENIISSDLKIISKSLHKGLNDQLFSGNLMVSNSNLFRFKSIFKDVFGTINHENAGNSLEITENIVFASIYLAILYNVRTVIEKMPEGNIKGVFIKKQNAIKTKLDEYVEKINQYGRFGYPLFYGIISKINNQYLEGMDSPDQNVDDLLKDEYIFFIRKEYYEKYKSEDKDIDSLFNEIELMEFTAVDVLNGMKSAELTPEDMSYITSVENKSKSMSAKEESRIDDEIVKASDILTGINSNESQKRKRTSEETDVANTMSSMTPPLPSQSIFPPRPPSKSSKQAYSQNPISRPSPSQSFISQMTKRQRVLGGKKTSIKKCLHKKTSKNKNTKNRKSKKLRNHTGTRC